MVRNGWHLVFAMTTSKRYFHTYSLTLWGYLMLQLLLLRRLDTVHIKIMLSGNNTLGSGGFRGVRRVQMHPPLAASSIFCVHNCTSAWNGYAAVACSNNNQAQLHTRISIPYWSPDVGLGLELLWDTQFGLPAILNNSLMLLASYQSVQQRQ